MTFLSPWVLLAIPVVVAVALVSLRGSTRRGPSLEAATSIWAGPAGLGRKKRAASLGLRGACLALGSLLVVVALARPQWGSEEEITFDQAREVVLALDLSKSMLANDVSPTRLDRSKLLVESLLDELQGERVGMVVFSGTAFLQSPLSSDYEVLRDLLPTLEPSYLPQGGTDYEAMLTTALRSFHDADGKGDRFLIVLSDGESHSEAYEALLPTLKARGVRVLGLGVGTSEGALVPDGRGGLVKDERGAVVLSRLEPATLERLAQETGGAYRDAATWVDLHELIETTVAQGTEGEFVESADLRLQDRFQWGLAPGILLLLLAFWRELPAQPSARIIRSGRTATTGIRGAVVPLVSLLGLVVAGPGIVLASTDAATPEEPRVLETVVVELVAREELAASDYAQLAEATVAYAKTTPDLSLTVRHGVIDDALLGVDRGERLDSKNTDWAKLRADLMALREPPQPPPSPESNQSESSEEAGQEGQDSQSGNPSGSESADSETGSSGSESQDEASSQSGDGEQEADENESSDASSSSSQTDRNEEQAQGSRSSDGNSSESQSESSASQSDSEESLSAEEEEGASPDANAQEREALQPREREDAGFGELADASSEETDEEDEEASAGNDSTTSMTPGERQESLQPPRQVGGGTGMSDGSVENPELASALMRMEKIRDQDSPGVLFQRMNALENPETRSDRYKGKNW